MSTLVLDGARGEGGGQILRTSLALSVVTGRPIRLERIRAGRAKPGLLRQHLACVRAAAAISGADVVGDELGSTSVDFRPGPLRPGDLTFEVGSAGSALLVLQTVLPALLTADGPSRLVLRGGTHNDASPPWHFVDRVFLPALAEGGVRVTTRLHRWGFFPAGGGEVEVTIEPGVPERLTRLTRGEVRRVQATAVATGIPGSVIVRELAVARARLGLDDADLTPLTLRGGPGPGNACWVEVEADGGRELFTGFGRKGVSAEDVMGRVVDEVEAFLAADVPVGEHLADQLLLPMALGGGGAFRTTAPSEHLRTQVDTIRLFLDRPIELRPDGGLAWRVEVG